MTKHAIMIGCCILCCSFGYAVGRITTVQLHAETIQPVIYEDHSNLVPTVNIKGVRNGKVHGSKLGNARLFIGDRQILDDGKFSIDAPALLTNIISIQIPLGMQFVASSRGKKYYPVTSSPAERLSPKYRRYFRTADEAEAAGYHK